jgi:hypothetical protein
VVPPAESKKRPRDLVAEPWFAVDEADVVLVLVDASDADDWRLTDLARKLAEQQRVRNVSALGLVVLPSSQAG